MDDVEGAKQDAAQRQAASETRQKPPPDRMWAERFRHPVKFRRFTGRGFSGKPQIFFQFDIPPDQERLDPGVYEILQELKRLNRGTEHGMGQVPTHLKAVSNGRQKPGTLWTLPDSPVGRTAADVITARLTDLADQLKNNQTPTR